MNSFRANLRFESAFSARLVQAVKPLLESHGLRLTVMGREGETVKQGLGKSLQREVGDFIVGRNSDGTIVYAVDLKVERRASRNLFFEVFSNASTDPERARLGWGMTLRADRLWYAFEDAGVVMIIDLPALRDWLNEPVPDRHGRRRPRLMGMREVCQAAHRQPNLTVGRLLPLADLPGRVWRNTLLLEGGGSRWIGREECLERLDAASQRVRAEAA